MLRILLLPTIALALVLGGCTSKDWVYENIFEGLKSHERLVNQNEPIPPESYSYWQYKNEREQTLKKNQKDYDPLLVKDYKQPEANWQTEKK